MQRGCSVNEHLNRYAKLLTDLVNVNVETSEEDKAVILLNSLPREEYEAFSLTFLILFSMVDNPLTKMRCLLHL